VNYYPRHIGDYLTATAHLSLLEHGVYSRLLDVYYTREAPIPDEQAERLVGARTQEEREAVRVVLGEFFELTDEGWRQARCDEEIGKYLEKSDKAKASAAASVNARSANAQRTLNGRSTDVELTKNQEPITPSLRSGVARATRLPPNWEPDDEAWQKACEALRSTADACTELDKFRDYWAAQPGQKGVKADWQATWRNWTRRASEYAESRGHSRQGPAKPTSAVERVREACNLDADGFPLGSDDGDLRPQVDEQLRHEASGNVVEAPFRVVS